MTIALYNTLTRQKEPFVPQDPKRVTMYACGPTVYHYAHIGNARPAVVFDLLYRLLSARFDAVVYARNITDVDDKINQAADEQGVDIGVIAKRFSQAYHDDMAALGVAPPTIEPRATDHMPQIIAMIETLIDKGSAYLAEGHVLFSVGAFDDYGRLSGRDRREMIAGARVDIAPYKKDPADFVLWKPAEDNEPGWPSPWGRGRPGWHIECSAMSAHHLGEVIDIHAGGQDLIFPHHENEIAQSRCAHGTDHFARYWLHNGFVTVDGKKMSKSLGNVLTVHDLLQDWPGEVLRYVLLTAHYRQPLDWSNKVLTQAQTNLDRLYQRLADHEADHGPITPGGETIDPDRVDAGVLAALEDDLNTPTALAALNHLAKSIDQAKPADKPGLAQRLADSGQALGLLQTPPAEWLAQRQGEVALSDSVIKAKIEARNQARADKDFTQADAIRDELAEAGIVIKDGPDGTTWEAAKR
ncbi:MAG: cysteine--tRNA ligase [Wenzhouxiangella sp.]|nr:cysteine--tRNA ligase [Wenzhouxiangella sp.]